eukprot:TRINITY_DN26183_c0_g1_i1.p1 TRINITY_DN26183_c0_g1~~TRINITY_DN26183_c0_g1_i1.p1  ORF type:complete len:230 (+),score=16.16 TRINITY_DN26183_c0_g1_i1:67-690(+)
MIKEGSWCEVIVPLLWGVVLTALGVTVFFVPFGECLTVESAKKEVNLLDLYDGACGNQDSDSYGAARVSNLILVAACAIVVLTNGCYICSNTRPVKWMVRCTPFGLIPLSGLEVGSFVWARDNFQQISDAQLGPSIYIAVAFASLSFLLGLYTAIVLAYCLRSTSDDRKTKAKTDDSTATASHNVNFKNEYLAKKFSEPLVTAPLAN